MSERDVEGIDWEEGKWDRKSTNRNLTNNRGESLQLQCTKERSNDGDLLSHLLQLLGIATSKMTSGWIHIFSPLKQLTKWDPKSGMNGHYLRWCHVYGQCCKIRLDDCDPNFLRRENGTLVGPPGRR